MENNSDRVVSYGNLRNREVFAPRNFWSGLLFGIGMMSFFIGTVFNQLLQWNHFYDLADEKTGVFSDGLVNLFAWIATVTGLFLLSSLRRRNAVWPKRWVGSALMGSGLYLLFDGFVIHKVFGFHQVRYGMDVLPYDIAWNASGGLFLLTGLFLVLQTKKENQRKKKSTN